ncbi:uncharacterized protein LOC107465484 [Arachis duranensis]|uniref:Uncharacterized protein LOC107465484 n=1 Tax=Arachis duranensis TaxID=130453 RepID=A0A6P4C5F3_ARADU|nr:uncharacterized protein LOC107465484 [Arachis duranensis]
MAKKKPIPQEPHQDQDPPRTTPEMEQESETNSAQIQNLKNLNARLLQETTDKRHQLDSLIEANKALQSKLDRYASENGAVKETLSVAADKQATLEVEQRVLLAFAETQAREMSLRFDAVVAELNDVVALKREASELSVRLNEERDGLRSELECAVREVRSVREKLLEAEMRERTVREEAQKLRLQHERLVEEGNVKEREIEDLKKERDLSVRSREKGDAVIGKLKEDIERAVREKNEIERAKKKYESRIDVLELEIKELNESLKGLKGEEASMRGRIRELEEGLGVAATKEKEMEMEVRALVNEKEELEKRIEALNESKDGVEKVLGTVRKELEAKQREIDVVIRVRDEIEQVKAQREDEIVEMQGEVVRLKDALEKLKESCKESEERNQVLLSEVERYRGSFDGVVLEKDNIRKSFFEEKSKVENLLLQVAGMEERLQQTETELDQMRTEREKLIEKNKMIEGHVDALSKERNALQKNLVEAQRVSDDLRAKIELSCVNSNLALALLKNTAALVCQSKDGLIEEVVSDGKKIEEDVQPFVEELDAIRKAFKNKDEMVDDMKQQLESLHKSVSEAHKNRNLWTVISSATTIFAAVFAAYAARGR